jgi:hypothetical protein
MPIHDWSRVEPTLFHDFHQAWIMAIRNALNGGLLPKGYSALVEQHAMGVIPDVVALETRKPRRETYSGGVVTMERPKVRHVIRSTAGGLTARSNRTVIRHALGRVVCMIEIVSRGNKASQQALDAFVDKTLEFLEQGANVVVVDLFPPTKRDPHGIHRAIFDRSEDRAVTATRSKPLTLASYVADPMRTVYLEPVAVGDRLVDMPAFLDEDYHVDLPLEETYQATWATCPEAMREHVLGKQRLRKAR